MKAIQVPTKQEVDKKAKVIFENLTQNLGMVPNLYATIGYSSDILEGYLNYSNLVGSTTFNKKEGEAIKLIVSEINGCEYCIAAHTAIAQLNGFSALDTLDIRLAKLNDKKLNSVLKLAQEIAITRGKVDDKNKESFYAQGYDNKAFIDLIALVNVVSFTNFVHNSTKVPIDFPLAPSLLNKTA